MISMTLKQTASNLGLLGNGAESSESSNSVLGLEAESLLPIEVSVSDGRGGGNSGAENEDLIPGNLVVAPKMLL